MGKITYEINHQFGYGIMTLNRSEKRNAISQSMINDLGKYVKQAKQEAIKCLIFTGAGEKMFSAGGDLHYFHGDLSSEEAFSRLYDMKEVLYEIVSFPVPTVCLLNGDALGGGCELATACDFRIAKEDTHFGFVQSSLGIIPGWGGGVLLHEKVDPSFAYQWLLEATIYNAYDLQTRGWIHHIVPKDDWDQLEVILRPYLEKSLEQMKILKSQYKSKLSVLSFSALMSEEVRQCAQLWSSSHHREKVQQFLTKK